VPSLRNLEAEDEFDSRWTGEADFMPLSIDTAWSPGVRTAFAVYGGVMGA